MHLRTNWTVVAVLLAAGAALALSWPPGIRAVDQQQARVNQAAPVPAGDTNIGQSFVAAHDGLSAVEVLAVVPAGASRPTLTLRLFDARQALVDSAIATEMAHNAPLRLSFDPQPHSAGQVYTLTISAPEDNVATVWAYGLDGYARGALLVDGEPLPADLQFTAFYTYGWRQVARDALRGLGRLVGLALPLWLVLFAPGLLFLDLAWAGRDGLAATGAARWGLALALSLSLLALAWLWVTTAGLRLSAGLAWGLYGAVGLLAAWRGARTLIGGLRAGQALAGGWRLARLPRSPGYVLAAIVLASLGVRLLAIRDLAFPPWVDSPHHAAIVALMAASGRVPTDYLPLLPIDHFIYHFGFHALAATLQWLTGLSTADLFLLLGQALNGLTPLAIYTFVLGLSGSPRAGLAGAFFAGMVSLFPAYFLSWGRYTQLTGALILPPALAVAWTLIPGRGQAVERRELWRGQGGPLAALAVLAAGLAVTHYRVLFFFAAGALVALALGGRGGWKRLGLSALLGGWLALPWLWRLGRLAVAPLAAAPGQAAAAGTYNALPVAYFQSSLERGWLLAALLAAGWGLLRGRRAAWFAAGWTAVVLAALNIGPGTWLVNNNSWAIMLFVPGSLLLGCGAEAWLAQARGLLCDGSKPLPRGVEQIQEGSKARVWRQRIVQRINGSSTPYRRVEATLGAAMLAGFAALTAAAGVRGAYAQAAVVNPATVLGQAEDAQAIDWIEANTSRDAVFAINSWEWQPNAWSGSDGGAWIWPLTGRRTTMPPLDYLEMPGWVQTVNDFNARLARAAADQPAEVLRLLRAEGVTHVYIGARGGPLRPELFAGDPHYQLLYTNGPCWVFALKPEGGQEESADDADVRRSR